VRAPLARRIADVGGAYRHSTRLFGLVTCALGLAVVVLTIVRGGGPVSLGVVVGLGFAVVGAGRYYLAGPR
jgi:hypothetical protein